VRTKLYGGGGAFYHYAAAEAPRRGVRIFESCALGGFCPPHSSTTRLHGGRGKTNCDACCPALLHTPHKSRDLLKAYREGYGGTSTRLYGGPVRMLPNCTATFFSLQPTNQPDDDDDGCCCCCCFLNIIIIPLLHSHIHCDLHHSWSILTLHDLHFFFNPRNKNFPPLREIFFPSTPLATLLFSNLPPEGREVT